MGSFTNFVHNKIGTIKNNISNITLVPDLNKSLMNSLNGEKIALSVSPIAQPVLSTSQNNHKHNNRIRNMIPLLAHQVLTTGI